MNTITVRVSDEEKALLEQVKGVYNCGISTLLKKMTFEKLEDDFDLRIVERYEEKKKKGEIELVDIEQVWNELGV